MHSAQLLANGAAYSTWFYKDGISYYINVLSLSGGGLATVRGIDSDVVRASIPAEIDFGKPTPAKTYQVRGSAFGDCVSLLSISYPASLEYIPETYGGLGCKNLQTIYVASGNKKYSSFGGMLFNKSQSLLYCCPPGKAGKVTIPSTVSTLGENSFYNCKQITSVDIPTSVVQINERAFVGCSSLREIVIPTSVKAIGSDAFTNCEQADLFLYPTFSLYNFLKTSIVGGKMVKAIYSLPSTWENIRKEYSGPLFDISAPHLVSSSQSKLGSLSWTFSDTITVVSVSDNNGDAISPDGDGVYTVTGLLPSTSYVYSVVYKVGDEERTVSFSLKTETPSLTLRNSTTTQQTLSAVVVASSDESVEPSEKGIYFNGEYIVADEEGKVSVTGLHSDQSYSYQVFAVYNGQMCMGETKTFYTKSVSRSVRSLNTGNTTISLKGTYDAGDLTVTAYGFTCGGVEYAGVTTFTLTGLKPNTTYAPQFWVETAEEGRYVSSISVTTGSLTFETQEASCTSNTSSTISAKTNCDAETGTGFEWRRIDAPDLVPSTYVECPVVDSVMAGSLRGLSAETYYQYRPYYKAADGTYFYGAWIGFGTVDTYVYFEPTVRTLDVETVSTNSAMLTGYALAGSDDIEEQGFEYWPVGRVTRAASDRQTVQASGQKMTVTLGDLTPGTQYAFRAYVKTAKGTTYGEEQTFTTPEVTGIADVAAAERGMQVEARGLTTRGDLQVRVEGTDAPRAVCRLLALGGATVSSAQVETGGMWQPLSAGPLSPGVYLLHVRAGSQTKTLKLMVR